MKDVFAVYKPKGVTSRQFLNELKKATGIKKWGHGGTLDPLAEGVLVVACNEGTKKLFSKELKEKQYLAVIKFGEKSSSDDEEGEKEKVSFRKPKEEQVKKILSSFIGEIEQLPPLFSAVKVRGKEAYKIARKGGLPEVKKRNVFIQEINLVYYQYPFLKIRVVTGPGTYIRSLARDIGEKLSCGAYLYSLIRERVGEFKIADCINVKHRKTMNLINICDENNNITSEKTTMNEAHKKGLWHRSAHIWIYNSKGEMLLQKRSKNSFLYPSMWDSAAAGHVDFGEDPEKTAIREVKEELDLSINKEDLHFYKMKIASNKYKGLVNNEFNYVYLLKYDVKLEDLHMQKEEVDEIGFFSTDFIEKDLRENKEKYVPHGEYWFKIIEEIKRKA